jgi:hypothetical protein
MKKLLCILLVCVLAVPLLSLSVSAAVPYDNAIAIYNMEGNLKNSVSGQEGTLKNGASFISDATRGNVLYLNNDAVESPGNGEGYDKEGQWAMLAAPYVPDSDQMTISIWLKVKELRTWARAIDIGDARAQNMLADGDTTTQGPNRFINISPTNGSNTIGTFNCNDSTEGIPNNRDRVFADEIDEGVWVHACLVIDAASGKPNVMYVNGVAFESTHTNAGDDPEPAVFSPKDILAAPDGLRNVFLGRSAYENNGDQIFNGWIDDVVIFNVALTADQVAELNKADLSKGNPANAVADVVAPPAENTPVDVPEVAPADPAPVAPVKPVTPSVKTGDAGIIALSVVMIIAAAGVVVLRRKAVK